MKQEWKFLAITSVITSILATKFEYKIIQENMFLDYCDMSLIICTEWGTYKLNRTANGLKLNFTILTELDTQTKASVKSYKFLSNTYRLTAIQFSAPITTMLKTSDFDLDSLFLNYSKPPLTWPLKTRIPYVIDGWYPDSKKFPANLLEGRWKIQTSIELKNQIKALEFSWHVKIEYIIEW